VARVGTEIPGDLEALASLLSRPEVLVAMTAIPPSELKPDGIGVAAIATTFSTPGPFSASAASKVTALPP
jgi:hypothetical protein